MHSWCSQLQGFEVRGVHVKDKTVESTWPRIALGVQLLKCKGALSLHRQSLAPRHFAEFRSRHSWRVLAVTRNTRGFGIHVD